MTAKEVMQLGLAKTREIYEDGEEFFLAEFPGVCFHGLIDNRDEDAAEMLEGGIRIQIAGGVLAWGDQFTRKPKTLRNIIIDGEVFLIRGVQRNFDCWYITYGEEMDPNRHIDARSGA
jgi:hypothetical protein